jgi:hypothetical protein
MNNNWDYTVHIQSEIYWFRVPRGPSLAFQKPKCPETGKTGNVRLYLVITRVAERGEVREVIPGSYRLEDGPIE